MRHGYHNLTNYRMLHIAKDSPFFEEYAQAKNTESFSCEVPSDWACQLDSTWRYLFPAKVNLPDQGWKIHLSSSHGSPIAARCCGWLFSQEESCFQAFGIVWELSETER